MRCCPRSFPHRRRLAVMLLFAGSVLVVKIATPPVVMPVPRVVPPF